jgi:hypothetical protein
MIVLPVVDANRGDTNLLGDFGNRQTALDPSVAEMAGKVNLARQSTNPSDSWYGNIILENLVDKGLHPRQTVINPSKRRLEMRLTASLTEGLHGRAVPRRGS